MKNLFKTVSVAAFSVLLTVSALAVGREESTENVPSGGSSVLFPVLLGAAVLVVAVAVIVVLTKRKGSADSAADENFVIVPAPSGQSANANARTVPTPRPAPARSAVRASLCAQGSFLGGRHYGIVTYAGIGRSSSAEIRVDDPAVSGSHCLVTWEGNALYLQDLGSTNGTYVRGRGRLNPNETVALSDGSVFWLGVEKNAFLVKLK